MKPCCWICGERGCLVNQPAVRGDDHAYIETNPERWALDRENPQRSGLDELESWLYRHPTGKVSLTMPIDGKRA